MLAAMWLLFALPLFAHGEDDTPTESELFESCSEFSQAGIRDCLEEKAKESEKVLQQAERDALDKLTKWDESDRYIQKSRANMSAAAGEFARYRKAHCAYSASLIGGGAGNGYEQGRFCCIAELNFRRAKQLRDSVNDLRLR
jgi:Arc/MetJ-type ribon-helix-helix transcriptional regulator